MPRVVGLILSACTLAAFHGTRSVLPQTHQTQTLSLRGDSSSFGYHNAHNDVGTIRRMLQDEDTPSEFQCATAANRTCELDLCSCAEAEVVKEAYMVILEWTLIVFLVMFSGLFSGLTLGLLSLDLVGLEVVIGGDPDSQDAKFARKIRPVRQKGNLLLCTLLLGNVLVNSALSILLASYTGGLVGLLVSTMVIVIFGEIIPQAFCSRHALYVGSKSLPIVKFFIIILSPVAWPISKMLDRALGDEIGSIYSSNELTKLLDLHVQHKMLDADQARMMGGALDLQDKFVQEVMTPVEKMFSISVHANLDFEAVSQIFKSGFSRIPVYDKDKNDVVGLLLTKDLIVIDPADCVSVRAMIQFFGRTVHWLWPDSKLTEALALFKSGRAHLAMVRGVVNDVEDRDPYYIVKGIITLEDIIEELIQDEIVDEYDLYVDMEDEATGLEDRMERATFDYARLRLFDSKHGNELSTEEADAVVAHVAANVPYLAEKIASGALTLAQLRTIVRSAPVVFLNGPESPSKGKGTGAASSTNSSVRSTQATINMATDASAANPTDADVAASASVQMSVEDVKDKVTGGRSETNFHLFKRGTVTRHCVLILSGKVRIEAGREGFVSEKGPWTVLGSACLRETPGTYVPDFTATVEGEGVRVLLLDAGIAQVAAATAVGEEVVVNPAVVEAAAASAFALAGATPLVLPVGGPSLRVMKLAGVSEGPHQETPPASPRRLHSRSSSGGLVAPAAKGGSPKRVGLRGPDPRSEEYREMSRSERMELFRLRGGSIGDGDAEGGSATT